MWEALEDAPYNAEEEMFDENVYGIADEGEAPSRLDVWNWFDERYRTGIAGLMGLV
jgi:hypothetical protein